MPIDLLYSDEKNELLKKTREICYEDVLEAIQNKQVLADIIHPNSTKYHGQKIYIINMVNYAYVVPYVVDTKKKIIFLKTLYPSRVFTKKFITNYEKNRTK